MFLSARSLTSQSAPPPPASLLGVQMVEVSALQLTTLHRQCVPSLRARARLLGGQTVSRCRLLSAMVTWEPASMDSSAALTLPGRCAGRYHAGSLSGGEDH